MLAPSSAQFEITCTAQAADIDMMGHVNNTVYLRWAQEVAIAHWQAVASPQDQIATGWVVVRHEIDYKTPALLGENVIVQTWVGTASGLIFERHTRMVRASDRQLLAQARTLWCPISLETGKPHRVSAALRAQFSATPSTPLID